MMKKLSVLILAEVEVELAPEALPNYTNQMRRQITRLLEREATVTNLSFSVARHDDDDQEGSE